MIARRALMIKDFLGGKSGGVVRIVGARWGKDFLLIFGICRSTIRSIKTLIIDIKYFPLFLASLRPFPMERGESDVGFKVAPSRFGLTPSLSKGEGDVAHSK